MCVQKMFEVFSEVAVWVWTEDAGEGYEGGSSKGTKYLHRELGQYTNTHWKSFDFLGDAWIPNMQWSKNHLMDHWLTIQVFPITFFFVQAFHIQNYGPMINT